MRNYKCYGTRDGRMPITMPDPADFGDSQKDAITMFHTEDGKPVILRRSIALAPMPWCVQRAPAPYSLATTAMLSSIAASAATQ